jgi:cyanoexosortase A
MKLLRSLSALLTKPPALLGSISIGLVCLHLILLWKLTEQLDQLILSLLFWGAIGLRLWQRRNSLSLDSDWLSSGIGLLLVALVLIKSVSLFWTETSFLRLLPGLAAISLGLLASGWRLQQFWREFLLLIPLMLPKGLILHGLETWLGSTVQTLTAQFSTFALHYLGFTVIRQGANIILPNGAVEVMFGCTGVPVLVLLLQLALLFIAVRPFTPKQRIQICIAATIIAFALSSLRIAFLALIVSDPACFSYWHGTQGSQIFSSGAIVLFGWYCHSLAEQMSASPRIFSYTSPSR